MPDSPRRRQWRQKIIGTRRPAGESDVGAEIDLTEDDPVPEAKPKSLDRDTRVTERLIAESKDQHRMTIALSLIVLLAGVILVSAVMIAFSAEEWLDIDGRDVTDFFAPV